MFFTDDNGNTFPLARIQQIGPEREIDQGQFKRRFHVVHMDNDDKCEISFIERARICNETGNMIPAQPGYFIVHVSAPDYTPYRCSIIAWAVSADEGILAVTPHGINDGVSNEPIIEMPDGKVSICGDMYENLQVYVDSLRNKAG